MRVKGRNWQIGSGNARASIISKRSHFAGQRVSLRSGRDRVLRTMMDERHGVDKHLMALRRLHDPERWDKGKADVYQSKHCD